LDAEARELKRVLFEVRVAAQFTEIRPVVRGQPPPG
jgi:hypothetical protein